MQFTFKKDVIRKIKDGGFVNPKNKISQLHRRKKKNMKGDNWEDKDIDALRHPEEQNIRINDYPRNPKVNSGTAETNDSPRDQRI